MVKPASYKHLLPLLDLLLFNNTMVF